MIPQLIRIIDILSYLNSTYNIKYERIPIRVIFKKKKEKIFLEIFPSSSVHHRYKQTSELLRHLSAVSRPWIHS